MGSFVYRAVKITTANGESKEKVVSGKILAKTIEDAREKLIKMDYNVIALRKSFFNISDNCKLSQKELINFFLSIASMDKVGVDILYALKLMKNDVADSRNLKKVCKKIYFSVATGTSLSEACKEASNSFTHDLVGLIKIAEQTGDFHNVFMEIVDYIKWNFNTKTRAKQAIRGPLMTLGFMIAVIIAMSTLILPKIIDFISYFNMETPVYTKILIYFASFVKNKWYVVLIATFTVYFCLKLLSVLNKEIGVKLDYLKLKIPLFGNLMLKIDSSRFITFFSIMYKNNADVLEIMDSVSKIVSNRYFGKRILYVRNRIADGETIFSSINKEDAFPVMLRRMMAVCETTGEVGNVLENVRYFYETEVKDTTDKVIGLIKPITTILLGVMVAWMGIAMLGPIYTNLANINNLSSISNDY